MNILGSIPSNGYTPLYAALDPNDPDYGKKMATIGAIAGHHELNAENTQSETGDTAPNPTMGQLTTGIPNEKPAMKPAAAPPTMPPPDVNVAPAAAPETPGVAPLGAPAQPHRSLLGKIGHGLEEAGNIAGDVFIPNVMADIPQTQLGKQRQQAIQFQRNIEQEREQERELAQQQENDYRQQMAKVAQQNAGTKASGEQATESNLKWKQGFEESRQKLAEQHENFAEAMGQKKFDQAGTALDARIQEFNEREKLGEGQLLNAEDRTQVARDALDIQRDALSLKDAMFTTTDAKDRANIATRIAALGAEKFLGGELFDPQTLAAAQTYAQGAPQPVQKTSTERSTSSREKASPSERSTNAPARPKGVPAGAKWDAQTRTWSL